MEDTEQLKPSFERYEKLREAVMNTNETLAKGELVYVTSTPLFRKYFDRACSAEFNYLAPKAIALMEQELEHQRVLIVAAAETLAAKS